MAWRPATRRENLIYALVVTFELADLADVLLRRHGLEVVHEAGVDVRIQVDVLRFIGGALGRVVLANPKPASVRVDGGGAPLRHRRVVFADSVAHQLKFFGLNMSPT